MNQKLKVVIKKPNSRPYAAEIEPDFDCFEKIVGGFLDFVDIPEINIPHLYIAIDDLSIVKRQPLNFAISELQYEIHGNAIAFGMSDDGDFINLTEDEINAVSQYMSNHDFAKYCIVSASNIVVIMGNNKFEM